MAQAEKLITDFGVSPLLYPLVARLWFEYLDLRKYRPTCFTSFGVYVRKSKGRQKVKKPEEQTAGEDDDDDEEAEEEKDKDKEEEDEEDEAGGEPVDDADSSDGEKKQTTQETRKPRRRTRNFGAIDYSLEAFLENSEEEEENAELDRERHRLVKPTTEEEQADKSIDQQNEAREWLKEFGVWGDQNEHEMEQIEDDEEEEEEEEEDDDDEDEEGLSSEELERKRREEKAFRDKRKRPFGLKSPQVAMEHDNFPALFNTLVLPYFACLLLREPIPLNRYLGWIRQGLLPHVGQIAEELRSSDNQRIAGKYIAILAPFSFPSVKRFMLHLRLVSLFFKVQIPVPLVGPMLRNICQDLELPPIMADLSYRIYCFFKLNNLIADEEWFIGRKTITLDMLVAVFLVIALKLCYLFHDFIPPPPTKSSTPSTASTYSEVDPSKLFAGDREDFLQCIPSLEEWFHKIRHRRLFERRKRHLPEGAPFFSSELWELPKEKLGVYYEFCRDHIFPRWANPPKVAGSDSTRDIFEKHDEQEQDKEEAQLDEDVPGVPISATPIKRIITYQTPDLSSSSSQLRKGTKRKRSPKSRTSTTRKTSPADSSSVATASAASYSSSSSFSWVPYPVSPSVTAAAAAIAAAASTSTSTSAVPTGSRPARSRRSPYDVTTFEYSSNGTGEEAQLLPSQPQSPPQVVPLTQAPLVENVIPSPKQKFPANPRGSRKYTKLEETQPKKRGKKIPRPEVTDEILLKQRQWGSTKHEKLIEEEPTAYIHYHRAFRNPQHGFFHQLYLFALETIAEYLAVEVSYLQDSVWRLECPLWLYVDSLSKGLAKEEDSFEVTRISRELHQKQDNLQYEFGRAYWKVFLRQRPWPPMWQRDKEILEEFEQLPPNTTMRFKTVSNMPCHACGSMSKDVPIIQCPIYKVKGGHQRFCVKCLERRYAVTKEEIESRIIRGWRGGYCFVCSQRCACYACYCKVAGIQQRTLSKNTKHDF
ncbi:Cell division control protein 45, variant 2 [Balamuthia mandrillaris]